MSGPVVATTAGAVCGSVEDGGIRRFLGIPYGADTGGDGRYRPPRPAVPWTGVRAATAYGPSSPQLTLGGLDAAMAARLEPKGMQIREPLQGEDCLVLNVWTPGCDDGGSRPVLVWFHGGGLTAGSASWPLYDFANLAARGDAVIVGVNHRLDLLGFLYLGGVDAERFGTGNVGMLDLVQSLEWVRDNIAAFGGDPANVTIFGESGGGWKVSMLLAMPSAQGLFHRAAAMSGAAPVVQDAAHAHRVAESVLEELGVPSDDLDQLQRMPLDRVVEAELSLMLRGGDVLTSGQRGVLRVGPVVDGVSLPDHPGTALAAGAAADVPLLVGTSRDEMVNFLLADPAVLTLDPAGLNARLTSLVGDRADALIAAYQAHRPGSTPLDLCIAITTDQRFRIPSVRLAEAQLTGGRAPVFMYLFSWGLPVFDDQPRAVHGSEMAFFFDNMTYAVGADDAARSLGEQMSEALLAFARDGDPGHAGLPKWPAYSLDERATMVFDLDCRIEQDPGGHERRAWEQVPAGELLGF